MQGMRGGGRGNPLNFQKWQNTLRKYLKVRAEDTAAAAAKSLQSCPTLCDPIDGSPPGSPIPGILQARVEVTTPTYLDLKFLFHSLKIT